MNISELLKETDARAKQIVEQVKTIDAQIAQLNEQRNALMMELLRLEGDARTLKRLSETPSTGHEV